MTKIMAAIVLGLTLLAGFNAAQAAPMEKSDFATKFFAESDLNGG
jgi:hypothetical protein